MASVYLQDILQRGEIIKGKYQENNHTFLLLTEEKERYIVDITADQYGGPEVYVGPLRRPWKIS